MSPVKAIVASTVVFSIAASAVVSFAFLKYFPDSRTPVEMPVQTFQALRTEGSATAADIE